MQITSFKDASLKPALLKAITELGYTEPSPIQAKTLPILMKQTTDFIGLAATGTGKTAAFSIPILEQLDGGSREIQALILCPTRELASQIAGQISLLGKYLSIQVLAVYGGASFGDQIKGLRRGPQIVVGTPGRLVDHMNRGTLKLNNLKTVILDEADEMISMGFKDDLEAILKHSSNLSQTWLFSATMSTAVRSVAGQYLKNPAQVQVNQTIILSQMVEQIFYQTQESNKPEVLCKIIDAAENFYGLIFCQTKSLVADLTQYLHDRKYKVDSLHGDKDQNSRERTMKAFRDKKINVLVCTDVASRGLDVKDVSHVINYSLPRELDLYVHRIGRTARCGKTGFAMNLVSPSQRGLLKKTEQMTKSSMKEGRIPTRKDLGAKKLGGILTRFLEQKPARAIELLDEQWKSTLQRMNTEEVAGRLLSLILPEIFVDHPAPEERPKDHPPMANTAPRNFPKIIKEKRKSEPFKKFDRKKPRRFR